MSAASWIDLDRLPVKSLFISDIHIGSLASTQDEELQVEAIEVLKNAAKEGFTLFLLGDIFDYWLEVGSAVPTVAQYFRSSLAQLAKNHEVYMVTGNHDNWTNGYFNRIGIAESSEGVLSRDGCLLAHGDGFKSGKFELIRPLKHRILRNPNFIKLFITIYGKDGAWQKMQDFSKASSLKLKNPEIEISRLNKWAEDVITKQRLKLVVCGHDHQARLLAFGKSTYLNTGFFQKERTFGLLDDGILRLMKVDSTTRNWKVVSERSLS